MCQNHNALKVGPVRLYLTLLGLYTYMAICVLTWKKLKFNKMIKI